MTITLGGISLGINTNNELVLRGLRAPAIATEITRSEGGVAHVLLAPMEGGRSLQLEGVITYAQSDAIDALIAAGVAVSLSHPLFSGEVLVLSTELVDFSTEFVNPAATNWLTGIINLLEV